jgi:hypothetical protein
MCSFARQALNTLYQIIWMRLESNFVSVFPLSMGAHTPFVLITVKFLTRLKLSLKVGRQFNTGSGPADLPTRDRA